jgi:hypothetical protein
MQAAMKGVKQIPLFADTYSTVCRDKCDIEKKSTGGITQPGTIRTSTQRYGKNWKW